MIFRLILTLFFVSHLTAQENIYPKQFRVELIKACEILGLSKKPNRKSKKVYAGVSTGNCVENLGCLRDITEKALEEMNETKRTYMAWKYPVWCKVEVNGKRGWVRRQFLSTKSCGESSHH